MIRSVYRSADGRVRTELEPEASATVRQDGEGMIWLDLVDEPPDSCEAILSGEFGFHPLAVDDALRESHVPKVDDWDEYLYLVLHAVLFDQHADEMVNTLELDAFVGPNYLVTYQAHALPAVERVWRACQRHERYLAAGVGHLLYRLADELANDYMPVVEAVDHLLDQVEDDVFGQPDASILARVFAVKRALLHLRRIIAPQREVLNKLARGDYRVIDAADRVFFRDVYDHFVRLYDITESLRDLAGSALETYLSVVNNRMNDVMKTLTIITTLFMPLSFAVGFFGMNFFQPVIALDAWTGRLAFGLTLGGMIVIPLVMYLWMRRRAWL